jgi:hypothetical protein
MIGNKKLTQIHFRLEELYGNKNIISTFGGQNILLMGDLFQVL